MSNSNNKRVTTQTLYETMTEGFHTFDKRLSSIERDVRGTNGEGLWDVLKTMRKEYREGSERHRDEHRRLWERLTKIEQRGITHEAQDEGIASARSIGRRKAEVWLWPAVAALIGSMQVVNIVIQLGSS